MGVQYSLIEIYTTEEARYGKKPLSNAVIELVSGLKIAARCMVFKGLEAVYENGEMVTQRILNLSFNQPLKIEIILPTPELDVVLAPVQTMVEDGVLTVRELNVVMYQVHRRLIPRQIKVRDVMTADPTRITGTTPVDRVVKLLLSAPFHSVPVVDETDRPIGIITQGDLVYRAHMPVRLSLLAESHPEELKAVLDDLSARKAREIMTSKIITIGVDDLLTKAVNLMLDKEVKRLPVVDEAGRLAGMLARLDVFRTITRNVPDWDTLIQRQINVDNARFVADVMRRDTLTVLPDTPAEEVLNIIGTHEIQRVCVVDRDGYFMGIIFDRDLLSVFTDRQAGVWRNLMANIPFTGKEKKDVPEIRGKTAIQIMKTDLITVREDTRIEEAINIMLEHRLKRLPVVDEAGIFKGFISRQSLLHVDFPY